MNINRNVRKANAKGAKFYRTVFSVNVVLLKDGIKRVVNKL